MAELKKKEQLETATEQQLDKEQFPVPIEISSTKNGIRVVIEGGRVKLTLSQYLAEHIGQFRNVDTVECVFKEGSVPDITAYRER